MRAQPGPLAVLAVVALQLGACSLVQPPLTEEQAVARVTEEFGFTDVTVVSVDAGLAGELHRGVPNSYGSPQEAEAGQVRRQRPAWRVVLRGMVPGDCATFPECPLIRSSIEAVIDRETGDSLYGTIPAPPPALN